METGTKELNKHFLSTQQNSHSGGCCNQHAPVELGIGGSGPDSVVVENEGPGGEEERGTRESEENTHTTLNILHDAIINEWGP